MNTARPVKVGFVGLTPAIATLMARLASAQGTGLIREAIAGRGPGDIWISCAVSCRADRVEQELAAVVKREFPEIVGEGPLAGEGMMIKPIRPRDPVDFPAVESLGVDLATHLSLARPDVLILAHPEGCPHTAHWVAEACLATGVALINATKSPLAVDPSWPERFQQSGCVLVGDHLAHQSLDEMAAHLIDAIRMTQLARERQQAGLLVPLTAWLFDHLPPGLTPDPAGVTCNAWLA